MSSTRKNPTAGNKGGRPPKFGEPSRPVTLTLPLRILDLLAAIDPDRAVAIAKLAEAAFSGGRASADHVELVKVSPRKALLLVNRNTLIGRIPGINLVEVAPARCLITLATGTPVESIEIAIADLLDEQRNAPAGEKAVLQNLRNILRASRRNRQTTKEEVLLVECPAKRTAPKPAAHAPSA